MRWVLGIEYRGTYYAGWQAQPQGDTVQSRLEHAITQVANHPVSIICAGRTDKGVHAHEQVVHFDSESNRTHTQWQAGINCYLPADIVVKWVEAAPEHFHARFSATARTYQYYIYHSQVPSALFCEQMLWEPSQLSVEAMQEGAQYLLGEHDFSAFRSRKCQAHSPIKTLYRCEVRQYTENMIVITLTANSFLYNMVRNIVGVMLEIGRGKRPPESMQAVLESKERSRAGVKVPAHGLYFMHVTYPEWPKAKQYVEKYLF